MINLTLKNKISALYLCADILDYPQNDYSEKLKSLQNIFDDDYDFELEDLESEYLRIFSIESSRLKCVPFASWWIDGNMSGISLSKISKFQNDCGYGFDNEMVKKPLDHISLMITFVAILLEDNRIKKIKEFSKFLTWLNDFANSLDKATKIKTFKYATDISLKIINSIKG